ncbi:MAG: phytoene/squalene synthase family protein [Candidatus Kapaibacteriota bacterium]
MISIFSFDQLHDLATSSNGGDQSVDSIQEAIQFCRRLAKSHYENFPVASILIPAHLRDHIVIIYAFSRIADDIADEYVEAHGVEKADHALALMHHFCSMCHSGDFRGKNPLWIALHHMFKSTNLPFEPFERHLNAFISDIHFQPMHAMNDVYTYCDNSANPIGELILRLHGQWDSSNKRYSDALCTALQMTNFLQDMSIDRAKGRVYIPPKDEFQYKDVENYLAEGKITPNFSQAIDTFIGEIGLKYAESKDLYRSVSGFRLRCELLLIHLSGSMMFQKAVRSIASIPDKRTTLDLSDYIILFLKFAIHVPFILFKH